MSHPDYCACNLCVSVPAAEPSPSVQSAPAADFEADMAQLSGSLNLMRANRAAYTRALIVTVAGPQRSQG